MDALWPALDRMNNPCGPPRVTPCSPRPTRGPVPSTDHYGVEFVGPVYPDSCHPPTGSPVAVEATTLRFKLYGGGSALDDSIRVDLIVPDVRPRRRAVKVNHIWSWRTSRPTRSPNRLYTPQTFRISRSELASMRPSISDDVSASPTRRST